MGAGCSSGGRALWCKGLDPHAWRIEPAWRKDLQFGLFSIPTSGWNGLIHQRLSYVLPCLSDSAYKRSRVAYHTVSERVAYVATMGFL